MATDGPTQNFANHQKFIPAFHYVALPILMTNVIYSGYVAATSFSVGSVIWPHRPGCLPGHRSLAGHRGRPRALAPADRPNGRQQ